MTKRRIKLVQIVQNMDLGGLQQVVYNICRTVNRELFELSVLCLMHRGLFADDLEAMGIPVHVLEQTASGVDYLGFLKVAHFLREHHVQVIHTHNTQAFIGGIL